MLATVGAIAFSGKAIIVKLAYRYQVDAVTLLMLRMLFALPFFLLLAWWTGRPRKGVVPVRLTRQDWLGVIGLGISGYYLGSFLDFAGLAYISASLERLILYLNPTLVLLLGWLIYRRRVLRGQVLGMAVSYGGVLLVFGRELHGAGPAAWWGATLVFASAAVYAVYLLYSGQLVKRLGSLRLVGLASTVACVCCIAQFAVLRPLDSVLALAPQVLWLSVLNATACTVVPVLLVMMAVERIGSALTAQSGMIGPVSTILLGVVLLGEPFTAWLAAGTALVIAGIFIFSRAKV